MKMLKNYAFVLSVFTACVGQQEAPKEVEKTQDAVAVEAPVVEKQPEVMQETPKEQPKEDSAKELEAFLQEIEKEKQEDNKPEATPEAVATK
jgi:hypothetical protein